MIKIIIIFLILFSINKSYAKDNLIMEKIVTKINSTKYKKLLPKIDLLIKKENKNKVEKIYNQIKKIDFKNPKLGDKKYILYYIILKLKDRIRLLELNDKINVLKFKVEKISKFNGIDISNLMKYKNLQEMPLSCEISATSDILSYLTNKRVKENELLKILDKSKFNKVIEKKDGNQYWGDPNKGFVGYINKLPNGKNASQRYKTGYGVLENPISKIYNSYGFENKVTKEGNIHKLLEELHNGNMVQMWGDVCTNPKYYSGEETICKIRGKLTWNKKREIKWKYKDENGKYKEYIGLNGEHAFYLLGYKGNYLNPTHIIIWDTLTGKHTYPTNEWMRKWGKMQYRSIIVYAN